jgi:hypothetical protein
MSWANLLFRTIGLGIPIKSWPAFIAEVYRVLKPGSGWAMFLEVGSGFKSDDASLPEDATIVKVLSFVRFWRVPTLVESIYNGGSRQVGH